MLCVIFFIKRFEEIRLNGRLDEFNKYNNTGARFIIFNVSFDIRISLKYSCAKLLRFRLYVPSLWRLPLNISPLPKVQNSSKVIHSQILFTHTILTKVINLKDVP